MSWFEKAKSAIIEALDIQDDDNNEEQRTPTNKGSMENVDQKTDFATTSSDSVNPNSNVNPVATAAQMLSSWGSFKGSFFENPKSNEMITSAPKAAGSARKQTVKSSSTDENIAKLSTSEADKVSIEENLDKADKQSIHSGIAQVITVPPKAVAPKENQENESEKRVLESQVITTPPKNPSLAGTAKRQFVQVAPDDLEKENDPDSKESKKKTINEMTTHTKIGSNEMKEKAVNISLVPNDMKIGFAQRQSKESEVSSSSSCMELSESLTDFIIKPTEGLENEDKLLESAKALIATNESNSTLQSSIVMLLDSDKTSCSNMQNSVDSDSTQSFEDIQMQASCQISPPSEEKSDFEKLDSKSQSSPPHSNDEMETATSSDIEIISHPNGDSSSTNSTNRTSPLKMKKSFIPANTSPDNQTADLHFESSHKRGHYREASEVSILSEDSQTEAEKLAQRINELNEILEAREIRLLQSERMNAALRDKNEELQKTVENLKNNTSYHDSTKQLSILEKKFQASLQESNALRIQIASLKNDMKEMIPKNELMESKQLVDELRLEGEKLSKEVLLHSNIIKKLRAKEKQTDATLKKNSEQLSQLNEEVERLKKTLAAKEEVERTQIETIHKLSSEKQKLFDENITLKSKLEDFQMKLRTLQSNYEAAQLELQQSSRLFNDVSKTAESAEAAKEAKLKAELEKQDLLQQMNELKEKLRFTEENMTQREQKLMNDNKELQRLFEAAELRAEASTQDVSLATIPLLRQIESLQKTLNQRTLAWNKEEKTYLEKLNEAEKRLSSLEKTDSFLQDSNQSLKSRCKDLEEKLSQALIEADNAKISLKQSETNHELNETKLNRQVIHLSSEVENYKKEIESLQESIKHLEFSLVTHKEETATSAYLSSRVLTEAALNEASNLTEAQSDNHYLSEQQQLIKSSPPNSFGANSLEDAIGGSIDWHNDDLDCVSNSGQQATGFGHNVNLSFISMGTTSTLEHLQSLLKQRDGEISHLQWELSRLQAEKNAFSEEISTLGLELENMKERISQYELMESNHNDLQTRYEALLEMFGEKVERMQELELDLIEARQAYKIQIDELLSQQPAKT